METVAGVKGSDEKNNDESGVDKSCSDISYPTQIADPVVYKLVRVEGDGRFVPATDDEVMEVEGFLVDDKSEICAAADAEQSIGCTYNEVYSVGNPLLEGSKGLSQSENLEADPENSSAQLKEIIHLASPSLNDSHTNQCRSLGESLTQAESGSSAPAVCASYIPNFQLLKGEICLDNLSIRELHELFKATFGRETTVKDKLWLKRRIAMGLTNSIDVSTTTFLIKDGKLVKKGKEESYQNVNGTCTNDFTVHAINVKCIGSPTNHGRKDEDHNDVAGKRLRNSSMELDCRSEDQMEEQRAVKRIRKPTKRYIEEFSESESRDFSQKSMDSSKSAGVGHPSSKLVFRDVKNISSDERTVHTRLDSLGGSRVNVPCVSRIRRSRPRKNVMALMKFNPSGLSMTTKLVKKALGEHGSQLNSGSHFNTLKGRSTSEDNQHYEDRHSSVMDLVEEGNVLELKQAFSSGDTSDENLKATIPTPKGGMRRKHHRAWSLVEVMKLVDGVSKCGAGRWSEIKRLAFASYSHRTSVDLKDKWRNLLKASFAKTPPDEGIISRKQASVPIPAPILLRVRELAEMHAQVHPSLSSSKLVEINERSAHEMTSGYL